MSGYNHIALQQLGNSAADVARAFRESWDEHANENAFNDKVKKAYKLALEKAKTSGVMPTEFQQHVPIDHMTEQFGIKTVALRELGKQVPEHPLVTSQACRDTVAKTTLIKYNIANRPGTANADFSQFAPTDDQAALIFKHTVGKP